LRFGHTRAVALAGALCHVLGAVTGFTNKASAGSSPATSASLQPTPDDLRPSPATSPRPPNASHAATPTSSRTKGSASPSSTSSSRTGSYGHSWTPTNRSPRPRSARPSQPFKPPSTNTSPRLAPASYNSSQLCTSPRLSRTRSTSLAGRCATRTIRRSPAVTATQSTRLPQPWLCDREPRCWRTPAPSPKETPAQRGSDHERQTSNGPRALVTRSREDGNRARCGRPGKIRPVRCVLLRRMGRNHRTSDVYPATVWISPAHVGGHRRLDSMVRSGVRLDTAMRVRLEPARRRSQHACTADGITSQAN
jgi:hypothetical protein